MSKKKRFLPKKAKPSYIYSIISISLVLFMIGLLGVIIINAKNLSVYFKENLEFSIELKDNVRKAEIRQFQKQLEGEDYVRSTQYITKEEATKNFTKEYGENFTQILGYSPLYSSINIYMKSEYVHPDSIRWIEKEILAKSFVKEVYYQRSVLDLINRNVRNVSIIIITISVLLLLIAVTLIESTIRLAMYSNRFLIKSMQLVGATRKFITAPFTSKSILNGLISGVLAVIFLIILIKYAQLQLPDLMILQRWDEFSLLFTGIILTGILISWWSTHRAVTKYLKMHLDDLY